MPLHVPVPAAVLEGDYSTWTKIWEFTFPQGNHGITGACFQGNLLYAIYEDGDGDYRFIVLNLTDGSILFHSPIGTDYFDTAYYDDYDHARYNALAYMDGSLVFSILGKYVMVGRYNSVSGKNDRFEIWKNGVLQWTSPVASVAVPGAVEYYEAGIRHDGKYIVALAIMDKLVCFEGS